MSKIAINNLRITANNIIAAPKPPENRVRTAKALTKRAAWQFLLCRGIAAEERLRYRPKKKRRSTMAKNNIAVPEAKEALERFKMEAASEVGVSLKQGYNGDLTSKQAGSIGGQMVKKMIESYEKGLK